MADSSRLSYRSFLGVVGASAVSVSADIKYDHCVMTVSSDCSVTDIDFGAFDKESYYHSIGALLAMKDALDGVEEYLDRASAAHGWR